jgi:diadenosine tetraphosphate (Ap4A) HIT family hydrolase
MTCSLCERVILTSNDQYPFLIKEFTHSFLYLGEHQYYEGYSVLVTKNHFREMTDIPEQISRELFKEMMESHRLIQKIFKPTKMNMCSLGNVVDHIHWHFFPRYAEDPNFKSPPWLQMHLFDSAKLTPDQREKVLAKIKNFI